MARLTPLRALRPRPELAPQVSSVPYDVVSADEARRLVEGNPLSFLRVTRSEVELPPAEDPHAAAVYDRARANLDRLRGQGALVREREPSLYVYRLRMGGHEQTGVAGGFSVDEYERDLIRRHETTRRDKEDDRTRHILTVRAQTGIVFLTYAARPAIDHLVSRLAAAPPLYDFVAADGVAHRLWRAAPAEREALVDAFGGVPSIYIADGHHRIASAWRARGEIRAGRGLAPPHPEAGDCERFLAVAFPDDQVRILPYHRVVADLAGRTPEAFAGELAARFRVVDDAPQPTQAGRVSVYLAGSWRTLVLPEVPASASPIARLDCERLQRELLAPLLGIGDPRTDQRIDFVGGIRGTAELERRVDAGRAAIAFAMHPVSVAELVAVSDAHEIMPPKSTWFEPKLRDGLLVHEV